MTDYLILGGGSAGCALAARLSEEPDNSVLLVEAGRNLTLETMPDTIRARYPGRAFLDPANIWGSLTAYMGAPLGNTDNRTPRRYEQGRVLGGGSAVNAMVANRGAPGDYDEWGALGAEGWSWDAALPYFRKLESDCDFNDPVYHGQDGPIPIRRIRPERMSPFVQAVCDTLIARGHPAKPDQNGAWADGVYVGAVATSDQGERVPASVAYLTPEVRRRPNLQVRTDMLAERAAVRRHPLHRGRGHASGRTTRRAHHARSRRDDRVLRRHPHAGASDAQRGGAGRRAGAARHPGRRRRAGRRPQPHGASLDGGLDLPAAVRCAWPISASTTTTPSCASPRRSPTRRRATCTLP